MKKIKDFSPGEDATLILRFHDVQIKKTNSNADYASFLAFDGEDTIEAKIWAFHEEIRSKLKAGEVYVASGKMKDYQGKMQFNITDIRLVNEEDDIDLSAFYEYAKIDVRKLQDIIEDYVKKIDNEKLKNITIEVIKKHYKNFFLYPAAVNVHHNYFSGLAYHIYSMLTLSDAFLKLYSYLDKDLVYAGIIVHDIGKIIELSGPKGTEYTKEGKLLGHISIGAHEVLAIGNSLGYGGTDELITLVHIILSHHGQMEYGSPKEPIVAEAALIHFLDLTDSRMASLEKEIEKTAKGEYTNPIIAFDRRTFYVPDFNKKEQRRLYSF